MTSTQWQRAFRSGLAVRPARRAEGLRGEVHAETLPSTPSKARTPEGGTLAPRRTASAVQVMASITCSRPTAAGHQAVARRLIEGGSDTVPWNSVRRSARAR